MKKKIVLWADDDWANFPQKQIKEAIVSESGIFHLKKENCYEGKPRKVEIIIREV